MPAAPLLPFPPIWCTTANSWGPLLAIRTTGLYTALLNLVLLGQGYAAFLVTPGNLQGGDDLP